MRRRIAEEMDRRGFTSPPHPSYRPRRASRTAAPPAPSSCPRRAANRATTPPSLRWLRLRGAASFVPPSRPAASFIDLSSLSLWCGWGRFGDGGRRRRLDFFGFLDCAGTEEGDEGDGRKGRQESDENHRVYIQLIWSLLA